MPVASTLRSRLGMLVSAVVWVGCGGMLAAQWATSGMGAAATAVPATLLVALLAWVVFWAPFVRVSDRGLVIRNIVREHDIPWSSVTDVGIGMALTVTTDRGRVVAWAAPSGSSGASRYGRGGAYSRMGSDSGEVAMTVMARWVELCRAGVVARASASDAGVTSRWLRTELVILAVLLAATVAVAIATR